MAFPRIRFIGPPKGELVDFARADFRAAQRATSTVIRSTIERLKLRFRDDTAAAGLGRKLGNALRATVYPSVTPSIHAAGEVYSKATNKRAGGVVDIFTAYREGATIRGVHGPVIAIPTKDAPRRHARGASTRPARPDDYPRGALVFVPGVEGKAPRLVLKSTGVTLFVLVPEARVRRRLNFDRTFAEVTQDLDTEIAAEWEREHTAGTR